MTESASAMYLLIPIAALVVGAWAQSASTVPDGIGSNDVTPSSDTEGSAAMDVDDDDVDDDDDDAIVSDPPSRSPPSPVDDRPPPTDVVGRASGDANPSEAPPAPSNTSPSTSGAAPTASPSNPSGPGWTSRGVAFNRIDGAKTCQPLRISWQFTLDDAQERNATLRIGKASSIGKRDGMLFEKRASILSRRDRLLARDLNETITPPGGVVLSAASFVWPQVDVAAGNYRISLSAPARDGDSTVAIESEPFKVETDKTDCLASGDSSSGAKAPGTNSGGVQTGGPSTDSTSGHNGISSGAVAAAVLVTLGIVAGLIVGSIVYRRRRRAKGSYAQHSGSKHSRVGPRPAPNVDIDEKPHDLTAVLPASARSSDSTSDDRKPNAAVPNNVAPHKNANVEEGEMREFPVKNVDGVAGKMDEDTPSANPASGASLSRSESTTSTFGVRRKPVPLYRSSSSRPNSRSGNLAAMLSRRFSQTTGGRFDSVPHPPTAEMPDLGRQEPRSSTTETMPQASSTNSECDVSPARADPTDEADLHHPEHVSAVISEQRCPLPQATDQSASNSVAQDEQEPYSAVQDPRGSLPVINVPDDPRSSAATIQVSWQPGSSPTESNHIEAGPVSASTTISFFDAIQDADTALAALQAQETASADTAKLADKPGEKELSALGRPRLTLNRTGAEPSAGPSFAQPEPEPEPESRPNSFNPRTHSMAESVLSQCQVLTATRVQAPVVGTGPVNLTPFSAPRARPSFDTISRAASASTDTTVASMKTSREESPGRSPGSTVDSLATYKQS